MANSGGRRGAADWRQVPPDEEAEAAYFARKYGLSADQLSARAKLEAAARRLTD
jgi:hypothetical protein